MELSKTPFYILSLIAIITTFTLGKQHASMQLALFACSPYLFILFLMGLAKYPIALLTTQVSMVLISLVGIYILLDTTYFDRNIEYTFSFLYIPVWQWVMLSLSSIVIFMCYRYQR